MTQKEKPILFSGAMVKAILEGRKSQSRRVVKPQPYHDDLSGRWVYDVKNGGAWQDTIKSPVAILHCCHYGQPGDRLWVREAFAVDACGLYHFIKSDWAHLKPELNWKPSIHLPRQMSRITLQIESVSVERVQDISHKDALAEGVEYDVSKPDGAPLARFQKLWDSINGKKHPWSTNPWVWKIVFRKI